uniref:Vesicle transport protein USE1 n=1 Tax=Parascaris equorum TaxID=6256 RepID=A0A914RIE4_PAREQ
MSEHVKAYLNEVESRARAQLGDRELLRSSSPLGEDQLRKMDSTLKRTTAFMKKLKNISAAQEAAISSDLEKVLSFESFSTSHLCTSAELSVTVLHSLPFIYTPVIWHHLQSRHVALKNWSAIFM